MSSAATTPTPGFARALRAVAIIPARLSSTRLPRKMLLRETGFYLFEHTVQSVGACSAIERVLVATDSREILAAARETGIEAILTSEGHASGTDRVHEAWQRLAASGAVFDVVVDVQGDEPDVEASDLGRLVLAFADPAVEIATLATPVASEDEELSPSVVKVVVDRAGDALYFSRAAIPSRAHARPGAPSGSSARRHVGVYAFRPQALARFASLPAGELEAQESLEQLRWLEAGGRIRVLSASRVPRGIDTAADYADFKARFKSSSRKDRVRA